MELFAGLFAIVMTAFTFLITTGIILMTLLLMDEIVNNESYKKIKGVYVQLFKGKRKEDLY